MPSPGELPGQGIELRRSPALQVDPLSAELPRKSIYMFMYIHLTSYWEVSLVFFIPLTIPWNYFQFVLRSLSYPLITNKRHG